MGDYIDDLRFILKATFKVGKAGLSDAFLHAVDEGLTRHGLVKVKFEELKDQKKTLAPLLAEKSRSHLVTRIGNVAVLYRRGPDEKTKPQAHTPTLRT